MPKRNREEYDGDYIIPIMGPTGAGKSTFINKLLGMEVVKTGHSLNSCTIEVQPIEIPAYVVQENLGYWPASRREGNLIILDTPGFDDTNADDAEILKRVADWLASEYDAGVKVAGLIYLQDICQRRVTGATKRNFEVFDKLCGKNGCKSVVLGTTQWTRVPPNEREMASAREKELRDNFWKVMIRMGSTMQRADDKGTSPWNLVETVLLNGETPTLLIQRELVDMNRRLPRTEAASALRARLEEHIQSLKNTGASKDDIKALAREVETLREQSVFARFFRRFFQ